MPLEAKLPLLGLSLKIAFGVAFVCIIGTITAIAAGTLEASTRLVFLAYDWTPYGSYDRINATIYALDVNQRRLFSQSVKQYHSGFRDITWPGYGEYVLFTNPRGDGRSTVVGVNVYNLRTRILAADAIGYAASPSPNSRWLAVTNGDVYRMDLYTDDHDLLLHSDDLAITGLTLSPDGALIALHAGDTRGDGDLYVMRADGSDLHFAGIGRTPVRWSPDGRRFVYTAFLAPDCGICLYEVVSGQTQPLNTDAGSAVVWSANSLYIAYVSSLSQSTIVIQNLNTGNIRTVNFPASMSVDAIAWSPDNSQLAFTAHVGREGCTLYLVNVDGSGLRHVMDVDRNVCAYLEWL